MIVRKNGNQWDVALSELKNFTGAPWIPYLQFTRLSLLRKYCSKPADAEESWLGKYFRKEILSAYLPPVSLRWIDDRMGWGVFAERAFPQMHFIAEYTGIVRKRRKADQTNAYCFEYLDHLIDAQDQGGLSRYLNHSDEPNLTSALALLDGVPHIIFYTARPILTGEELRYDYGPDYWKHRTR